MNCLFDKCQQLGHCQGHIVTYPQGHDAQWSTLPVVLAAGQFVQNTNLNLARHGHSYPTLRVAEYI